MAALQESNLGTVVKWITEPSTEVGKEVFKRVFWAFGPSIEGFNIADW